jgi:radical SAM protein with 4Fe4S-binding SPASM domain
VLAGIRNGLPKELRGICSECLMRGRCQGCCVAANYQRTGDLLAPFWFCEAAAAAGLFPASRRK